MKLFHKTAPWAVLTGVFATLLVATTIGNSVAMYFEPAVNSLLGAATSKIEKDENAENVDTEYFKSSFAYTKEGETKLVEKSKEVYHNLVEEGSVLLKNEKEALPFASSDKKIAVYGNAANLQMTSLKDCLTKAGYEVNDTTWDYYKGLKATARTTVGIPTNFDDSLKVEADVALVTLQRRAGEGTDCAHPGYSINKATDAANGDYLDITPGEEAMFEGVKALKDAGKIKKIVVIINTSNMVHGDFINDARFGIDACLWTGQANQEYGVQALVDLMKGDANFSGRLVDTIWQDNMKNPVMVNYGNVTGDLSGVSEALVNEVKTENYKYNNNPQGNFWYDSVVYQEGIYLGYKYYETRYEDKVMSTGNAGDFNYEDVVAYPFGYGLSYSAFSYSNYKVVKNGENFEITVDVKNEGKVAGKNSVLVYLQKPYTDYAKKNGMEQAAVNLVGYTKTSNLAPGATESVKVEVPAWQLRTYDSNNAQTYVLDSGVYYFTAAGSSHEAVNNILTKKGFNVGGDDSAVYAYSVDRLDKDIYAKSYANDAEVTNLFDSVDLNKDAYASKNNKITYVSRSDWMGTLPTEAYIVKYNEEMVNQARPITYKRDPNADVEMPKFNISNGLSLVSFKDTEYTDPLWTKLLQQMSYEETAKLVTNCWYGSDAVASVGKLRNSDMDSSMGRGNPFKANPELSGITFTSGDLRAATFNKDLQYAVGIQQGEQNLHASSADVKAIGLYGFSPNIHRSPYSGRNGEYFSEDAFTTGMACGLAVKGMTEKGSVCFCKHYFLNDQEDERHGIATWANEQTLRETYLPAFEYTVTFGGGMGFMNSFNRIGMMWPGEHPGAQKGFLYGECGFMGNIVTDLYEEDLQDPIDGLIYGGTTMWLATHADSHCYGLIMSDEYRNDPVFVTALVEAAHRMLYGASRNASINGLSSSTKIIPITPWWQVALISAISAFAVLTAVSAAGLVYSILLKKKQKED